MERTKTRSKEEKANRTAEGINSTRRVQNETTERPARCTNQTCDREFFVISCKHESCFMNYSKITQSIDILMFVSLLAF